MDSTMELSEFVTNPVGQLLPKIGSPGIDFDELLLLLDRLIPQPVVTPWRMPRQLVMEQAQAEELRKEVTSYKIQIRMFKEFIHELIRRTGAELLMQGNLLDGVDGFQSEASSAVDGLLAQLREGALAELKSAIDRATQGTQPLELRLEVVKLEVAKRLAAMEEAVARKEMQIGEIRQQASAAVAEAKSQLGEQRLQTEQLRSTIASIVTSIKEPHRATQSELGGLRESLQANQGEVLLLRGELDELRQQLRESESARRAAVLEVSRLQAASPPRAAVALPVLPPAAPSPPARLTVAALSSKFEPVYETLLLMDVANAEKLLELFEKILDDKLLGQARNKLKALRGRGSVPVLLGRAVELHQALFKYFTLAVEAVVTEHVLLLLDSADKQKADEETIEGLRKEVARLEQEHDPELKVRLEEVHRRWKREREARQGENKAAKERIERLEREAA